MNAIARAAGYRRPITAMDRWYLAHPRTIPPILQVVVEGVGDISQADLVAAVDRATAANPGCRLRKAGKEWVADGPAPRVRVVAGTVGSDGVADIPALHDPLPADGALCEVLWCPGKPSALVFRASHAIMDGQGRSLWMADVFRALRGEEPVGAPSPITEIDVFEHVDTAKAGAGAGDGAGAADQTAANCPSPLGEPGKDTGGAHRTAWARRTVDGYHPGLVAKVATALTGIYGLDVARFGVAFDLRRHLPGELTTGNLVQTVMVDVPAGQTWEELYERLLAMMAADREVTQRTEWGMLRLPVPVLRQIIKLGEAGPPAKRRYGSVTAVNHLSRAELVDFCTPAFEAQTVYSAPLLSGMAAPDLNLIEVGGRTELVLSWRGGPGATERMESVLDQVAEALVPRALRIGPGSGPGSAGGRPGFGERRDLSEATVVDLLRERVAERPDAEAVRWPQGSWTFAELEARSSAVAAALARRGAGREAVVGILAERTPQTLAGIWGILKAGAAYLPLDPQHPDERLAGVLADAGAELCLIRERHRERPALLEAVKPLSLDEVLDDESVFDAAPDAAPDIVPPKPGDLAYVIYTSGSTGKPKGVEIEHRALANYTAWATRRLGVDADTCFAVFSSLAFDLSNTALYLSTLAGGSVVMVPDEPNHLSLRAMLETSGANALKLTPSHLDLIGRLDLRPAGFRLLVVGGEQLRPAVVERAREQFGAECRVVNHYGPTEATIGCVANVYDSASHGSSSVVPIGIPADNCAVRLLDSRRRPVAVGEVGEIYLSGAQVARGYRGRPDLTRERFVRLAGGSRAYRTGDLARMAASGEIEYVGRADDQVKIMGHRVEPAEVANLLETYPGVRECAVVVRSTAQGSHALCAYAVSDAAVSELADFLRARLPRYLVPAAIRLVPAIPRTLNGKVDARALPDPFDAVESSQTSDGPGPVDPESAAVAEIWARHLGIGLDRLDAASDFHELGGDSVLLLAMLATVSTRIAGPAGEAAFMAELGRIVAAPTLGLVRDLAVAARTKAAAETSDLGSTE
jgi:amino acid adenylation domain-containing protein